MPEKMEVCIPDTLDIKASNSKIGEMYKYGNNPDLYIVTLDQKVSLKPFAEMMDAYWATQTRVVKDIIIDHEDNNDKSYFNVYLEPVINPVYAPRVIKDNPQA